MATYKKDYSCKTAIQWLAERKWKGFLMRVPINKTKGYLCQNANDVTLIRTTAAQMSMNPECDRKFSVIADYDTKVVTVTATKKQ